MVNRIKKTKLFSNWSYYTFIFWGEFQGFYINYFNFTYDAQTCKQRLQFCLSVLKSILGKALWVIELLYLSRNKKRTGHWSNMLLYYFYEDVSKVVQSPEFGLWKDFFDVAQIKTVQFTLVIHELPKKKI